MRRREVTLRQGRKERSGGLGCGPEAVVVLLRTRSCGDRSRRACLESRRVEW